MLCLRSVGLPSGIWENMPGPSTGEALADDDFQEFDLEGELIFLRPSGGFCSRNQVEGLTETALFQTGTQSWSRLKMLTSGRETGTTRTRVMRSPNSCKLS